MLALAGLFAGVSALAAAQSAARVVAIDGRAELTDPAGDIQPIIYRESVGTGPEKEVKYPGFDVVKLTVSSDGKAIAFAAGLASPPARASYEVLEIYIDADNNPKTEVTHPDAATLTGMEYYGTLEVCLEHPIFGTTCAGTDASSKGHTAVVMLQKFGRDWMFKDALLSIPAAGSVKEPRKSPITGAVVQATLDYAAMGLEPGQTIRAVVREYCAGKVKNVAQGFFPEVVLTLK
jgi:hypothetical protein